MAIHEDTIHPISFHPSVQYYSEAPIQERVAYVSISESRISLATALGPCASLSLNILSITDSSVAVVSIPQNEIQSLTTMPPPITSLPRLTVPACATEDVYR